ncbi:polysaccharide pyruvyl transferase family protein [Gaetbulibacter sp. M235]|uniref:polysaccharide pyruvyl transferase family protein n=1 Tax=Gaetbulibacter sp. M235 TaxID=3126510 RepID=UPI00374F5B62
MKKILIKNFKNLNNYGSGMMGLVTIDKIFKELKGNVQFYSDFDEYASLNEIKNELNNNSINLNVFKPITLQPKIKFLKPFYTLYNILNTKDIKQFDLIIVLGGDDLSEYYGKHIWPLLLSFYSWSFKSKMVLLGQSIGPFNFWLNRFVFKKLANRSKIFTRDKFCFDYIINELGIIKNVTLSGDLAFLDLPLQKSIEYQEKTLLRFDLVPNEYVTIIISGLFGKYYTDSKEDYFGCFKELIIKIKNNNELKDKKICFIAHTFPPHGNESDLLKEFEDYVKGIEGLVFIKDKIYQGAARFILGNGKFTITGRMHASVSTFQMGKPSISLSYSVKYRGVIGNNLGQNDLIIESNNPELWKNRAIVDLIYNKISYLINDYDNLTYNIRLSVIKQKELVDNAFDGIIKDLK